MLPTVGKTYKASRELILIGNAHIRVMSTSSNRTLPKHTEVSITAIGHDYFEIACRDGFGIGPQAWGLKLQVKKHHWGQSFEAL